MKITFSAFREFVGECRALSRLRADVLILGAPFRRFIVESRGFRLYWFTRCMGGAR